MRSQSLFSTTLMYDKDGKPFINKNGKPMRYPSSGALIKFISVASTRVRGRQHSLADRENVRPSLALTDYPQNDDSAKLENEVGKREEFIRNLTIGGSDCL